jgi:hypothetical protein
MSNNSGDGFGLLIRMLLKNFFMPDEKGEKGNDKRDNLIMLLLLAILAFVGAEAVKVTFRTNFGREALNMGKIIVCSLLFWVIAFFAFDSYRNLDQTNPNDIIEIGYPKTFLFAAIFYVLYGLFVLLKGIAEIGKANRQANINPLYKGDSYLSSLLNIKNQTRVQSLEEPFLVLSIGILFAGFNFLLGLPLVFCAISTWGYQAYEYISGHNHIDKILEKQGYTQNRGEQFSEIK